MFSENEHEQVDILSGVLKKIHTIVREQFSHCFFLSFLFQFFGVSFLKNIFLNKERSRFV